MKREFILALRNEFVQASLPEGCSNALSLTEAVDATIIAQREFLETSESYRQLISYTVLRKPDGTIFVYQRGKGVGEQRLAGDYSCGIGGHVEVSDVIWANNEPNLVETVRISVWRELYEECGLTPSETKAEDINLCYFINDNSNPVGRVHLGLVAIVSVEQDFEATMQEVELEAYGWKSASEIANLEGAENWTTLVAQYIVDREAIVE